MLGCGSDPLRVIPDSMPDGQVGVPYSVTIQVRDNDSPLGGVDITEGELPPGLTLDVGEEPQSLLVAGTPTVSGTFPFSLYLWCFGTNTEGQSTTKDYSITVTPAP